MDFKFKDKRILICQPMIAGITGSTVVAFELVDFLIEQGAKVVVYTCYYGYPMRKFFEDKKIKVVCFDEEPELHFADFDYVWVNSQIMPRSMVKDFGNKQTVQTIFCHMSGLDIIPDERPWITDFEKKICSLRLFVSERTKEKNEIFMDERTQWMLFPNPAPDLYGEKIIRKKKQKPERVLVVSNHPPEEIYEAKSILEKENIEVKIMGELNSEPDLISRDLLEETDVVITIGKTVQYCLVSGTPVYIYDHFGGKGFLNKKNYENAKKHNFSGREAAKKDAKMIATEIINDYKNACEFYNNQREKFKKEFLNKNVIPKIFETVNPIEVNALPKEYLESVLLSQSFAARCFQALSLKAELTNEREKLKNEINTLKEKNKILDKNYNNVVSSEAWKIGKAITHFPSKFKRH